ncbi:acid-sensing ion channel 4-A-like [Uloborus diversus]|uniref:acid-sensing ion channel 4-A-like n=1 Tax=Uloborus diversus TaxID=327109 RepID=UPI0024091A9F|nr:acid-sensing ion channel 4-A-like [Uloborus diversus]
MEADFWQDQQDLTILLDAETEEFTESWKHPGLTITIHWDRSLPDVHTDGLIIETGYEYEMAIQQSYLLGMRECVCGRYPREPDPRKIVPVRFAEPNREYGGYPIHLRSLDKDKTLDWSWYIASHLPSSKLKGLKSPDPEPNENLTVFQYFVTALSKSSISGVTGVTAATNVLRRILWAVVLSLCLIGFAYQTYHFSQMYMSKPSVVQIEVENDGLAEFPAITLCNTNRVRRSEYCYNYPQICNATPKATMTEQEIGDLIYDILQQGNTTLKRNLGHQKTGMIQSCIFNGKPKLSEEECFRVVEHFYDPDLGNCYTIPPKNERGQVLEASEADFWQEANDMSVLIDIETDENMETRRHPGLLLTIHDEENMPDVHTDGLMIEPGLSYSLAVQKSTVLLLPLPYNTNCTDYFKLPWQARYKRRLTSRMCTVGCSQYYQQQRCSFITKNLSLFFDELPYKPELITKENKDCAEREEANTKDYCRSICGLPCRDTTFTASIGSNILIERELFQHNIHTNPSRSWKDKMHNLALLRVYYSTLEHKIYRHIPKYDTMELFSYLGGYSGVWLGFSLLTVYELLEIVFTTILFAIKKHKKYNYQKKIARRIFGLRKHSKKLVKKSRNKKFYR